MQSAGTALCDTGPLVALFSRGQFAQEECEAALRDFRGTLVTTFAVLTEAFHFIDEPAERNICGSLCLAARWVSPTFPSPILCALVN